MQFYQISDTLVKIYAFESCELTVVVTMDLNYGIYLISV